MAQLRHLGPGFDPAVVAGIDAKLHQVEASHGVRILLAIESGSRGWGFPSPDSDYDCRFIHVRPLPDYLSLYPPRDVIEYPPDAIYDVNGWDLVKTLKLLLKGNAVVLEWLMSPFVYRGDAGYRAAALALAGQVVQPAAIAMHYLHLGERQRQTAFANGSEVRLKKLFYVLRPALALRWMRLHPAASGHGDRAHGVPDNAGGERCACGLCRDHRRPARPQGRDPRDGARPHAARDRCPDRRRVRAGPGALAGAGNAAHGCGHRAGGCLLQAVGSR